MKKHALLALSLSASLLAPSLPVWASDITGHWAQAPMEELIRRGVLKGTAADTYEPNRPVTRAEFSAMVARHFSLQKQADLSAYTDVSSKDWFADSLSRVVAEGLLTGVSKTSLAPQAPLTRQDAVVLVARLIQQAPEGKDLSSFEDHDEVSSYAKSSFEKMVALGVVEGENNHLYPKRTITRAEAAKLLLIAEKKKLQGSVHEVVTLPPTKPPVKVPTEEKITFGGSIVGLLPQEGKPAKLPTPVSPEKPKPEPEKPAPKPEPEKPAPKPEPEKPAPKPEPEKPAPKPEPEKPAPKPEPEKPAPKPEPEKPAPKPEPEKPAPKPEPEKPAPKPEPEKPVPKPEPPTPTPEVPTPEKKVAPTPLKVTYKDGVYTVAFGDAEEAREWASKLRDQESTLLLNDTPYSLSILGAPQAQSTNYSVQTQGNEGVDVKITFGDQAKKEKDNILTVKVDGYEDLSLNVDQKDEEVTPPTPTPPEKPDPEEPAPKPDPETPTPAPEPEPEPEIPDPTPGQPDPEPEPQPEPPTPTPEVPTPEKKVAPTPLKVTYKDGVYTVEFGDAEEAREWASKLRDQESTLLLNDTPYSLSIFGTPQAQSSNYGVQTHGSEGVDVKITFGDQAKKEKDNILTVKVDGYEDLSVNVDQKEEEATPPTPTPPEKPDPETPQPEEPTPTPEVPDPTPENPEPQPEPEEDKEVPPVFEVLYRHWGVYQIKFLDIENPTAAHAWASKITSLTFNDAAYDKVVNEEVDKTAKYFITSEATNELATIELGDQAKKPTGNEVVIEAEGYQPAHVSLPDQTSRVRKTPKLKNVTYKDGVYTLEFESNSTAMDWANGITSLEFNGMPYTKVTTGKPDPDTATFSTQTKGSGGFGSANAIEVKIFLGDRAMKDTGNILAVKSDKFEATTYPLPDFAKETPQPKTLAPKPIAVKSPFRQSGLRIVWSTSGANPEVKEFFSRLEKVTLNGTEYTHYPVITYPREPKSYYLSNEPEQQIELTIDAYKHDADNTVVLKAKGYNPWTIVVHPGETFDIQ